MAVKGVRSFLPLAFELGSILEQDARMNGERRCYPADNCDCRVFLPTLDAAQIAHINAGFGSKGLLRQATF